MDSLLTLVLGLYKLAQCTSVNEFPDLALEMLKAIVKFRSATWSEAEIRPFGIVDISSVHLHNEPDEVRVKFSSLNQRHTRRVLADAKAIQLLTPHLFEALAINRALAVGERPDAASAGSAAARALIDRNGCFLHCGTSFRELLRREWRNSLEPAIPPALLTQLLSTGEARIADGRVAVSAWALGDAYVVTARQISPLARLSPREIAIARQFGLGKSHKTIARDLQLAPATVRNVLQKAYRKLGIDNKATLARLIESEARMAGGEKEPA